MLYRELSFGNIKSAMESIPSIFAYLYASPERCKKTVSERKTVDSDIPLEYLRKIHILHFMGALYFKMHGKDVRFIQWTDFGDSKSFMDKMQSGKGSSVVFENDRDSIGGKKYVWNKDFDVSESALTSFNRPIEYLDYGASLKALPEDALKLLNPKHRFFINTKTQEKLLHLLGSE